MKIFLNGEARNTEAATLDAALIELGLATGPVATAVNECFVPAANRASQLLSEGDRIEVLSPRQGG